jgi:uncharacterized repeat protein (TIGR03943 family)
MSSKLSKLLTLTWLPLGIWLVKSLVLSAQGRLGAYIHPRFFTFTALLCFVGLLLIIASYLQPSESTTSHNHKNTHWRTTFYLLVAIATAMMPPLSLSSSSVINRGSDTYAAASPKLTARYDQFSIKEWSGLLSQTNDSLSFVGKPIAFEGFVSRLPSDEKPGLISRFGVTCCAIDAQPISLPIRSELLSGTAVNQWLRIKGVWQRDNTSDKGIVMQLSEVTQIEQPKEPYVY